LLAINIAMKKIFVNVIGINDHHIQNVWRWIKTQIIAVENVELCHDENSTTLFLQLSLFLSQDNFEKIQPKIERADKIIISDLLNYDNNYNFVWQDVLSKITHHDIVCVTNNRLLHLDLPNDLKIVFNDFLLNRTKLYYFDQNNILKTLQEYRKSGFWLYTGPDNYQLNELTQHKAIDKIFLSLTRNLLNFRRRIVEYLIEHHNNKGYIGCHELGRFIDSNYTEGFCPIPNQYYDKTFAAIYCESTSLDRNIFHATEKTFEPLLKGIFILPYSNTDFVENLQKFYGFKMPDLIDYEYDSVYEEMLGIAPENKRVLMYLKSIDKLCNLNVEYVTDYYTENFDIIEHNREVIASTPYSTLIDKIWQQ
jgi:hypothetical protein